MIGLFNLIPVLPLDGGNIVQAGLDRIVGERSHRWMLWFSLSMTGVFAVLCFTSDRARGLFVFVGFLLVTQLQMLGSTKQPTSPWDDANAALADGKEGKARRILMATLSTPAARRLRRSPRRCRPPTWPRSIDLLPDPLPFGDPLNEYVLANQLIRIGRFEDAAHYAAASFQRNPHTLVGGDRRPRRRGTRRSGHRHRLAARRRRRRHHAERVWRRSSTSHPSWPTCATTPR